MRPPDPPEVRGRGMFGGFWPPPAVHAEAVRLTLAQPRQDSCTATVADHPTRAAVAAWIADHPGPVTVEILFTDLHGRLRAYLGCRTDDLTPPERTTFADQTTALALAPGKRRDLDDVSGSWRRPDRTRLFPQGQPFTTADLQLATPGAPDSIRIWHAPTPTPGARAIRDHIHQTAPAFLTPQPAPVAIQFTYDARRLQWLGVIVSQPASAGTHQVNCWAIQTALTTDAPGAGTW